MIDSNVYFNICNILNCGSKPDKIGFQNAETTCKMVHNELIWRWSFNEVTGLKRLIVPNFKLKINNLIEY